MIEIQANQLEVGDMIHVPGLFDKTAHRRITERRKVGGFLHVVTGKYFQQFAFKEMITVYDRSPGNDQTENQLTR